ncbi:MAG: hypothetical protein GC137_10555 [Alphaproteobacteria bacterium]|nr:hypothetical protein [Alphaproteobacteria bacterium]
MPHSQTSDQSTILTLADLDHFHGSEQFYRLPLFRKFIYTEGVQYVAEKGAAYWLLEKIFACQSCVATLSNQPFTVWTLEKKPEGHGATLTCSDGNNAELYSENIVFTDFPLQSLTLWLTDNTLLLPSEY